MKKLEQKWPEIKRRAESIDEFDRTVALVKAVGALEIALTASEISRRGHEGVKPRLERLINNTELDKFPEPRILFSSIYARNKATHEHLTPSIDETIEYIGALHKAWRCMRRNFVNRYNATNIAHELLDNISVSNVFLFGSLSRGEYDPNSKNDPKDIDLLLFDYGDFSYYLSDYSWSEWIDEFEFIDSGPRRAALKCGWLQFVFVDGSRFGTDRDYTLSLAKQHHDQLFFLNLADGLLQFDRVNGGWTNKIPQVFKRLVYLRRQLETENILAPLNSGS